MPTRLSIFVANWKMHKNFEEGLALATRVVEELNDLADDSVRVIILPSFIHLEAIQKLLATGSGSHVCLGAQNCHEQASGAFTGEVSASMLRSVGAAFVLIGHNERRIHLKEDGPLLAKKVDIALAHGLKPIFCCGENMAVRERGDHMSFVHEQLSSALFHLSTAQIVEVIIAYEPVWAIGTGNTPTAVQVQTMHRSIRRMLAHQYGQFAAQSISILYGGSCTSTNAATLLRGPDVDGGLIGHASLDAKAFVAIIRSLQS